MKQVKGIKLMSLIGALAFSGATLITSCSKEEATTGNGAPSTQTQNKDAVVKKAQEFMSKIEKIKIVDDNGMVKGSINTRTGGFSFADGGDGFNFSSSSGVEWVPSSNGGTLYISAGSFGGNAGGGTVQAGNTSLEINHTFCMSADDSTLNLDFFGPGFSGVSMVLGISGDFEAILNGSTDTTSSLENIFNGMALYVIYADEASGSYDVVNWLENLDEADTDPDAFANQGFAFVMDFKDFALYLATEGELNVSGGSIGFSGKYLGITDENATDLFEFSDDAEVNEVDGVGVMGCN